MSLQRFATATGITNQVLPSGMIVRLPNWTVQFPPASPSRLLVGVLKPTYTSKPLVDVDGESVFGELAIVRWLAKDRWSALWADTFHGRKFWSDMPHRGTPVDPPARVKDLYDRIAMRKGGPSGCFDVVAWSEERIVWLEYKGPKDKPNRNELCWLEAAIGAGVRESDLVLVGEKARPTPSNGERVNSTAVPTPRPEGK